MKYILIVLAVVIIGSMAMFINKTPTTEEVKTDDVVAVPEKQVSVSSKALDLSGQGLIKVPEYVFNRTDIESLDLSNNKLAGSLQAEIRHLQNLRSLDLSNNNFTGLPAEVGQLKNLQVLNLSDNSLTGLPYELGNLSNLKLLDLTGNNYSQSDLSKIKESLPTSVVIKG